MITLDDLKAAGYTESEFKESGLTKSDLENIDGYLKFWQRYIKLSGSKDKELGDFTLSSMKKQGYTLRDLKRDGDWFNRDKEENYYMNAYCEQFGHLLIYQGNYPSEFPYVLSYKKGVAIKDIVLMGCTIYNIDQMCQLSMETGADYVLRLAEENDKICEPIPKWAVM